MWLKIRKSNPIFQLFLWLYAIISLYPLVWMLFYSLKDNNEIFVTNPFGFPTNLRFENYTSAISEFNVPQYFLNSVFVTVITVVGTIVLAVMFAYSAARLRWRGKTIAQMYIVVGMFVPVQVIMIPLAILVRDFNLTNTYSSLIIPYIAFNISFSSMVFYGFFRTIPNELEESACLDGANIYQTFYKIMLPLVKPSIATMVIFVFLAAWNEYPIALMLISDESLKTLPLGLQFFQGQFTTDWGAMGAAMTIASLPTVLVYILFSEQVEKAMTVGSAVKG
ncbi:carbohydrate ABC transporter permease [Cohnella herbarum]|uniref:Carbohydrate ABC transporter permease n=1 Tax=Cohnella herbarum TaxID=2728023 RepID=A0A7Z2VF57_9BACL|nr:carbohydrate ABC transporter permease [Cohnella herbarum]QJD82078.1 carbohydrate ABC transporter permease [Cohnella herbarum]